MLEFGDANHVSGRNGVCSATSLQPKGALRTRQRERPKQQAPRVCLSPSTLWLHCSNAAPGNASHALPENCSPPYMATEAGGSAGGTLAMRVACAPTTPRPDIRGQGMYIDRLLDDERSNRDTGHEDMRYGVGGISVSRPIPNGHGMFFNRHSGSYRCAPSDAREVPSSSLAFFSDDAIDSMCQRVGHDRLKTLVNTLEETMKARWQAAEVANNRPQSEDWGHCDANWPLYIQCLLTPI